MQRILQILVLIFTIVGCSDKPNKKSKTGNTLDTVTIDSKNNLDLFQKVPKDDITNSAFKIDFPLDSLLSFDSEEALKRVFGEAVKRSIGYYPEGMGEYTHTLLFPDSKDEVAFVWEEDSVNLKKLQYIKVFGKHTDWKTKEGITIGTTIKELELLNKKPFTFFGLGWDYAGSINWVDGYLDTRGISGSLAYLNGEIPKEFEGLLGDHEIESSSEIAQEAALVLGELIMRRNN